LEPSVEQASDEGFSFFAYSFSVSQAVIP